MSVLIRNAVLIFLTIFLASCFNIPIGDGNKIKFSKKGFTVTDDDGDEHRITIDDEEGEFKVKGFGSDGEDTNFTFGENLDPPDSFPANIPIPDDVNIYQVNDRHQGVSSF